MNDGIVAIGWLSLLQPVDNFVQKILLGCRSSIQAETYRYIALLCRHDGRDGLDFALSSSSDQSLDEAGRVDDRLGSEFDSDAYADLTHEVFHPSEGTFLGDLDRIRSLKQVFDLFLRQAGDGYDQGTI